MRNDVESLYKRYCKAKEHRELFRDIYERAYKTFVPHRNLYNNPSPGQKKTQNVYDSTGVHAANRFVNHMQASLTPPFKKWVEISAGPGVPAELKNDINEALERMTETAFEYLNCSNFNVAISEYYYDLLIGTAALLTLPGESLSAPLNFVAVPIEQISIEEGPYGNVIAVYRCHKVASGQIKDMWPDAHLPGEVEKMIKDNPLGEVEIIECSYEVKGKFYYDVVLEKSKERIVERQAAFNRWIITRLNKVPGELYGRGPGVLASDDMLMLNKVKELGIRSAQLNAFGLYTVADSDVVNPNTLQLTPGSFIPVSRNGGPNGPSIAALPRGGDVNWQQLMVGELQTSIKQMLLNDRLPPEIGPVRSATEVAERQKSGRIDTESYFGRLMFEFVQPLWANILAILDEKELINLPDELKKIDNNLVKIKVLSPIAKEQNFQDVQSLIQAVQIMQEAGGPEMAGLAYKLEDMGEWIGEKLGVPSSLVRSAEERKAIKDQQQQAQEEQMMQEMAMQQQGQAQ